MSPEERRGGPCGRRNVGPPTSSVFVASTSPQGTWPTCRSQGPGLFLQGTERGPSAVSRTGSSPAQLRAPQTPASRPPLTASSVETKERQPTPLPSRGAGGISAVTRPRLRRPHQGRRPRFGEGCPPEMHNFSCESEQITWLCSEMDGATVFAPGTNPAWPQGQQMEPR